MMLILRADHHGWHFRVSCISSGSEVNKFQSMFQRYQIVFTFHIPVDDSGAVNRCQSFYHLRCIPCLLISWKTATVLDFLPQLAVTQLQDPNPFRRRMDLIKEPHYPLRRLRWLQSAQAMTFHHHCLFHGMAAFHHSFCSVGLGGSFVHAPLNLAEGTVADEVLEFKII